MSGPPDPRGSNLRYPTLHLSSDLRPSTELTAPAQYHPYGRNNSTEGRESHGASDGALALPDRKDVSALESRIKCGPPIYLPFMPYAGAVDPSKWDAKLDSLLATWRDQCGQLATLHGAASDHYNNRDSWLGVPLVILGCGTTASSLLATFGNSVAVYVTTASGLMFSLGVALQKYLKYSEKATAHKVTARQFESLVVQLDTVLAYSPTRRPDADITVSKFRADLTDLLQNAPDLPDFIERPHRIELTKLRFPCA